MFGICEGVRVVVVVVRGRSRKRGTYLSLRRFLCCLGGMWS